MSIALPKQSVDLEKAHLDQDIKNLFKSHKSSRFAKPVISVAVCFVLSLIVMIQNLALFGDDKSAQFAIEVKEGNNESNSILNGVRQSLQMVTFFAEDFSFANYTGINDIDTFDAGNKFEFYYTGYRKVNNHPYTREAHGLNIFGVFVDDVGVQLATISKSEDADKLINSLTMTFSHTVMNLDEMYHTYKRTGELPGHFDETKLKLGHSAHSIENYGKLMTNFPTASVITSLVSCISLLILTNYVIFRSHLSYRVMMASVLIQVPQSLVQFCGWASQLRFYYKIIKASGPLNLIDMSLGSGFTYLGVSVLFTLAIQAILIWVFVKR